MSEGSSGRRAINAPAKLNLGLEILGKRLDGYHDLATIFLTVSLFDQLTVSKTPPGPSRHGGDVAFSCHTTTPELDDERNLVVAALQRLRAVTGLPVAAHVELDKSIPIAGGLGGASSDAAAVLVAARHLWQIQLGDAELQWVAAAVGSDVPFFIRGGCALGGGRGDVLEPLPMPDGVCFVLVSPTVHIPTKTATLYRTIGSRQYSDGGQVTAQAARLRSGAPIDYRLLGNAFTTSLYALVPGLADLPTELSRLGAPVVALSGAGPTHFVPFAEPDQANAFARQAQVHFKRRARIELVTPVPPRLDLE